MDDISAETLTLIDIMDLIKSIKEIFKKMYTLSLMLSLKKQAEDFYYAEFKAKQKDALGDVNQRMKYLNNKIHNLEISIKDDLFKNKKFEREKKIFETLNKMTKLEDEESKESIYEFKEKENLDEALIQIVAILNLKQSLTFIFESKGLIIQKMDEVIKMLKSKAKVTYEEITKKLQEVLRIKSTIEEVVNIK